MKNKTVKALALAMAVATVMMGSASIYASDDTLQRQQQRKQQEKKTQMMTRQQQTKSQH